MDEPRYLKHLAWKAEVERRWRAEVEPPVAARVPPAIDVAAIRRKLGRQVCGWPLSQEAFAARFGFSLAAVRDWEQGRRRPNLPTRVLLLTIASDAAAVDAAIQAAISRDEAAPPAATVTLVPVS